MNREVIVEPPNDIKKEGFVWKIAKPLYGLKDAIRKFWLRLKELFKIEELLIVKGDKAFYLKQKEDCLFRMIMTHMDNFIMAGTNELLDNIE